MNLLLNNEKNIMNNRDARNKRMNAEADRFINDLISDSFQSYAFYRIMDELQEDNEDINDFANAMGQWLRAESGYNTDWDHFSARFAERESANLGLWKGTYHLATSDYKIFRLRIADPDPASSNEPEPGKERVYLNGISIEEYTFQDRTLTWDRPDAQKGSPEGKLIFSNFLDQKESVDTEPGNYVGQYCVGSVVQSSGMQPTNVKGKIDVFSYEALRGDYGVTDSLDYWAGKYDLYVAPKEKPESQEGVLEIFPSEKGEQNVIHLNGAAIKGYNYSSGMLSWHGKVKKNGQDVQINDSGANLGFTKSPDNRKIVRGNFHPQAATEFLTAGGLQMEKAETGAGDKDLEFLTTELPVRFINEKYAARMKAKGGSKPYVWEIEGLPEGFDTEVKDPADSNKSIPNPDLAAGRIIGTPKKSGTSPLDITVTDAAGGQLQDYFDLTINAKADKQIPSILSKIISWLPALATVIIAAIGIKVAALNRKNTRELEDKKIQAAKDAAKLLVTGDPEFIRLKEENVELNDAKAALEEVASERDAAQAVAQEQHQKRIEAITAEQERLSRESERLTEDLRQAREDANVELERQLKAQEERINRERDAQEATRVKVEEARNEEQVEEERERKPEGEHRGRKGF